jgi:hypothetical protein
MVLLEDGIVTHASIAPNAAVRGTLKSPAMYDLAAIEQVRSYGMAVGAEVFDTCVETGRFVQAVADWVVGREVILIPRMDVKMHLCHSPRAKDGNVRQALLDRLGPVGTKSNRGPCYGVSGHAWAALAVAVVAWDRARQAVAA